MDFVNLLGAGESFNDFSNILKDLINKMWIPCMAIASALTLVWALYLGFKFWSAGGDEQKKKSAKSALISFAVGIIVIFVVAVGAPVLIGALGTWMSDKQSLTYIVTALMR